jgi:hypothetical protein
MSRKSTTPEYYIWCGLKQRCLNPRNKDYHKYGGRGIMVFPAWIHDFDAFLSNVGQRPGPAYSLDRYPNPNGHYEPGNVRWATYSQQNRNTRVNRLAMFDGRSQCLMAWAEDLGIGYRVLRMRIERGWSIERAFTTPTHPWGNNG